MVYCVAYGCNSRQTKGCGISFFRFPKDKVFCKQWVHYCKRADFKDPTPSSRLCSKHFSGEKYEIDPVKRARYGYENAQAMLKDEAIPDIPLLIINPNEASKTDQRTGVRGAFEKRQRAETLNTLLNPAATPSTSAIETEETEAPPQENSGLDATSTSSSSGLQPKKTRDASFQIGGKSVKPKMFVKRTQVKPSTREYGTQTLVLKRTTGTQYEEQTLEEVKSEKMDGIEELEDDDDDEDVEEDNPNDEDYIPSDECEVTEEELDIETDIQEVLHADVPYKERQFLVAESCLLELLSKCKQCGDSACVTLKSFVGTMVVVEVLCAKGHDYVWRSQVLSNSMPWGNLLLSSAILFSGSSPAKVINLFSHLNVPVFTTRTFSSLQYAYLVPSVLRTWDLHQADLLNELQGETLSLGGDARCDSPGHSAKFGSYTLMNLQDNKILHVELIQSNEVKNSFNMELEGLKRGLEYLNDCGMAITELVTDRHVQVKKFMSDKQPDTHHFFDVWHMAKGVSKKLEQAAKKKECALIRPWIKSVVNHMYWIAASCGKDSALKKAKWISIVNHICDKHEGHDDLFPKCEHGPILETKQWIKTGSRAYKALLAVVKSPYLLRDIGKLSPVHQTYGLEVYHNIVNHFGSKSMHYFYESMLARVHLAALHFNENSGKPQATTKTGNLKYAVAYPKAKKGEEAVVKPQREGPTYKYVRELLEIVTNRRLSHPNEI